MLDFDKLFDDPCVIFRSKPFVPYSEQNIENILKQMVIKFIILNKDLERIHYFILAHQSDVIR